MAPQTVLTNGFLMLANMLYSLMNSGWSARRGSYRAAIILALSCLPAGSSLALSATDLLTLHGTNNSTPKHSPAFGHSIAVSTKGPGGTVQVIVGDPEGQATATRASMGSVKVFDDFGIERLHLRGLTPDERFGEQVTSGADYNGDGVDDVLVTAPQARTAAGAAAGRAYLFSGSDGSPLLRIDGESAGERLGTGAGSQNNTFIVSNQRGGVVVVRQGISPTRLTDPRMGSLVTLARDLNADGTLEILTAGQDSAVRIFSVDNASPPTLRFLREDAVPTPPKALTILEDLTNDAVPEYAVGSLADPSANGVVSIMNGRTGEPVSTISGQHGERLGSALASIADVNDDGVSDLVVGALGPTSTACGFVQVRSGRDANLILSEKQHTSEPGMPCTFRTGHAVASAPRFAGSHHPVYFVAEPLGSAAGVDGFPGAVHAVSSAPIEHLGRECGTAAQTTISIGDIPLSAGPQDITFRGVTLPNADVQVLVEVGVKAPLSRLPDGTSFSGAAGCYSTNIEVPAPRKLSPRVRSNAAGEFAITLANLSLAPETQFKAQAMVYTQGAEGGILNKQVLLSNILAVQVQP